MADELSKAAKAIATVLGVAGVSKSIEVATQTICDISKESFSLLLKPAFEETGLLFQDVIREWRQNNARRIAEKADQLPREEGTRFNPVIAYKILEAGSTTDDEMLQNMWAGLLASSCTEKGDDDSDLLLIQLVANMTRNQAKIIAWLAGQVPTIGWRNMRTNYGFGVDSEKYFVVVSGSSLQRILGDDDLDRLHNELFTLMESSSLLDYKEQPLYPGEESERFRYGIRLSPLGLYLYIRCQGSRLPPEEYFRIDSPQS